MTSSAPDAAAGGGSRNLILAAMIFAVSMMFIDQSIVSIAAPQKRGVQAESDPTGVA